MTDTNSDRFQTLHSPRRMARQQIDLTRQDNERLVLSKRAVADKLNVGDSVLLIKSGQLSLTPQWTSRWSIHRARHPTYWIVPVERVVHRRRIQVVPHDTNWSYSPWARPKFSTNWGD